MSDVVAFFRLQRAVDARLGLSDRLTPGFDTCSTRWFS